MTMGWVTRTKPKTQVHTSNANPGHSRDEPKLIRVEGELTKRNPRPRLKIEPGAPSSLHAVLPAHTIALFQEGAPISGGGDGVRLGCRRLRLRRGLRRGLWLRRLGSQFRVASRFLLRRRRWRCRLPEGCFRGGERCRQFRCGGISGRLRDGDRIFRRGLRFRWDLRG
jgi:hypothetical protein